MAETVAFLFADLAGSTRLVSELGPPAYAELLSDYRRAVADAVAAEGGEEVDREGDGLFLVLPTAASALRAAADGQRRLTEIDRPDGTDVAVRMGIHVGEVHPHDDGYVGVEINRAARVGALAHGGQVLVSEAARLLAEDSLDEQMSLRGLGEHRLKGLDRPERVHQLVGPGLRTDFPPLDSARATPDPDAAQAVAVLPFGTLGGAEDAELLALGLHNDLLTELSKVGDLTVISRTSVLRYRDTDEPIPTIARELNAGTIVEGTVQRAGDRVRLNVQMIDGIDDSHRWAESYDRELTTADLFDIQADLTRLIARSLEAVLVPARRSEEPRTMDLDAYRLVALGRHHFGQKTEEGFQRAIELFEQALEIDHLYVDAWVGLADSLALMEDYRFGEDEELLRRAHAAAERALELDPDSAGAHASLGLIHNTHQDGPASIREFEHAIRLQPSYADAHNWHSWVSLLIGRATEGRESAARAVELDPLSAEPIVNLSLGLTATGDPDGGASEARRARELSPFTTADLYEGIAHYEAERYAEAITVLRPLAAGTSGELTVPWAGHGPDATLVLALVAAGSLGDARSVLGSIDVAVDPFAAGLAHLSLDEIGPATDAFARVTEMSPWPCLALHHYHADVWQRLEGSETHRELHRVARRSWQMDLPSSSP